MDNAIKWRTNPNLLDNADFVGGGSQLGTGAFPINQRSKTVYSAETIDSRYTIDRWFLNLTNTTLTLSSDCITLENGYTFRNFLGQSINDYKKMAGRTVTLSAVAKVISGYAQLGFTIDSGTISHNSGEFRNTDYEILSYTLTLPEEINEHLTCAIINGANSTIAVKAVKLEEGTTQTLAHLENGKLVLNEIPNYQQELAKCQRYLVKLASKLIVRVGVAYPATTSQAIISLSLPVVMRSKPTVTYSNLKLWNGGTSLKDITSISANTTASNVVDLSISGSDFNVNAPACLRIQEGGEIILDANI